MDRTQIEALISRRALPDTNPKQASLVETHISYVILGQDWVYKIKKPFHYTFLDFSTLTKRKYYCEEELRLNRRLAAAMYHQVLPIYEDRDGPVIPSSQEEAPAGAAVIDYALEMRRMDSNLEMDKLLARNAVTQSDVEKIAVKVARFHEKAPAIYGGHDPEQLKAKFRDIRTIEDFLGDHLPAYQQQLTDLLSISDRFVGNMNNYLKERHDAGMIRDCHGDLHSKNIFLYEDPVIFDCIEFNQKFRQIDILNEIAFFSMDLEVNSAWELSRYFYHAYQPVMDNGLELDERTAALFTYFKAYRANVRGKVIALKQMNQPYTDKEVLKNSLNQIKRYLDLMSYYLGKLPEQFA